MISVLVNFQDNNLRGMFWVLNAALQKKKELEILFRITEINFNL